MHVALMHGLLVGMSFVCIRYCIIQYSSTIYLVAKNTEQPIVPAYRTAKSELPTRHSSVLFSIYLSWRRTNTSGTPFTGHCSAECWTTDINICKNHVWQYLCICIYYGLLYSFGVSHCVTARTWLAVECLIAHKFNASCQRNIRTFSYFDHEILSISCACAHCQCYCSGKSQSIWLQCKSMCTLCVIR